MAPTGDGKQKHVVIVGAGAAGMSCAATLAQHPDKFKVTVLERGPVCGGQATSIPLDSNKFGAAWMNNGVQGGSPVGNSASSGSCVDSVRPGLTLATDIQTHL